jgi:hypothetical protein
MSGADYYREIRIICLCVVQEVSRK